MTNYGDIATAWFDVPMTLSEAQSQTIYDTVRALQPKCLINSRLGKGKYDFVSLGDNEIPKDKAAMTQTDVDYNDITGFKPSPLGLYETAGTINDSWGIFLITTRTGKPRAHSSATNNTSTILALTICSMSGLIH